MVAFQLSGNAANDDLDECISRIFAIISHLFNRCPKRCTSRKSGTCTGTLLFDGMYDVGKKMICSADTHAL